MSKTRERIRDSQLRYQHGLGQNFIYDEELLQSLAEKSGVGADDDVLEIGPGTGTLTQALCRRAHHVRSLELDARLIDLLSAFMADYDNFSLRQGDALTVDLADLTADLRKPLSVVANIPYYITTPLIQRLLSSGLPLKRLALMVQREVADKLLSSPGQDGWGPLAIRCRYLGTPVKLLDVPAACFTPAPKVDSAFVLLPIDPVPTVQVRCEADFFKVVGAAFALRRKTLVNSLAATLRLERADALSLVTGAGLDERVRGEQLSLSDFARLSDRWTAYQTEHSNSPDQEASHE